MLGLASSRIEYRTGIFRVVERLAHGLAVADAVDLSFSSLESAELWALTRAYVRASPGLDEVPLAVLDPMVMLVSRMLDAHAARRGGPGVSVLTKAVRRFLLHGRRGLQRVSDHGFPRRAPDADVFHSPRFALPSPSRTGRGVRMLTVYDLIPIVAPQYCGDGGIREAHGIIGSLRPGDWALAISESAKADLCEYRRDIDPSRVLVTPLAADPATFYPVHDPARLAGVRERYGIPDGPYLLSLNTVEPRKNMERAVRAFARFVTEEGVRDLSFVLVGNRTPGFQRVLDAAAAGGASPDRVVMTGYVDDGDLAPLYSGALGFVYPSLYEGFGLPPLEAMQCGTPVITSNNSSLPEVVGDAGIMVDPRDEDALCQAMLEVYRDENLRARLADGSLKRAAGFSWDRFTAQTIAGYATALAGR
jgi:glycosyltransferase involved in cell wall biosynthesis